MSRIIGLYQMLMRRYIEHFLPDATLESAADRSFIRVDPPRRKAIFRLDNDPDGLGLEIEMFRTRYLLTPGSPSPFLSSEKKLVEAALRVLDRRFRAIYDTTAHLDETIEFEAADQIVAEYLGTPDPHRIPSALEALRAAALSTYENRRVSTGALLLGTSEDPAYPGRINPPGAPRYSIRLSAIRSFHKVCDGLHTLFVVDRAGELAWAVDVARWAERVQGNAPLESPCARIFEPHARATRSGRHVVLVLTPSQQIKVFVDGTVKFVYGDARWRLLDIPTKVEIWCRAVGDAQPQGLAQKLFRAALNLAEERHGALFVVMRDPTRSLPLLLAPGDRMQAEVAADDPDDPENLAPRLAKRALHHLARGQAVHDLDDTVLEALAGIDGAVVVDRSGELLSFGAILRVSHEMSLAPRAVEGARTTAALAGSHHGPVLKVSEDGQISMFLGGRRVWEL